MEAPTRQFSHTHVLGGAEGFYFISVGRSRGQGSSGFCFDILRVEWTCFKVRFFFHVIIASMWDILLFAGGKVTSTYNIIL